MNSYTVGSVAAMAGISVRTLRHYDDIGLLRPTARSDAGYRQYTDADLTTLQQILFYRSLDFPLDQITGLMNDRTLDSGAHFRRQRELLIARRTRLDHMIEVIDRSLEAHKMDIQLTPEERLEVFGGFNPDDYEQEAQTRWGNTQAYQQSARRASKYTKADWQQIKAEGDEVVVRFIAAMRAGTPADDPHVMEIAEAHRQQISKWFYDCSYEIQTGLAQMYIADERFTAYYDNQADGLAQYVHDAILSNAINKS